MITMNEYLELISKIKEISQKTGEDFSAIKLGTFIKKYAELLHS